MDTISNYELVKNTTSNSTCCCCDLLHSSLCSIISKCSDDYYYKRKQQTPEQQETHQDKAMSVLCMQMERIANILDDILTVIDSKL